MNAIENSATVSLSSKITFLHFFLKNFMIISSIFSKKDTSKTKKILIEFTGKRSLLTIIIIICISYYLLFSPELLSSAHT